GDVVVQRERGTTEIAGLVAVEVRDGRGERRRRRAGGRRGGRAAVEALRIGGARAAHRGRAAGHRLARRTGVGRSGDAIATEGARGAVRVGGRRTVELPDAAGDGRAGIALVGGRAFVEVVTRGAGVTLRIRRARTVQRHRGAV